MNKIKQFFGIDISKDVFDVVANKLLKQSLAIAKSGLYYDENFRSVYLNNV